MQTGSALIHDAVRVFSSALRDYTLLRDVEVSQMDCAEPAVWRQGRGILRIFDQVICPFFAFLNDSVFRNLSYCLGFFLRKSCNFRQIFESPPYQKTEEGITGRIAFNEYYERSYFDFDIVELHHGFGLRKIAYWDPVHGINMTRPLSDVYDQVALSFSNKTFIVASRVGMPYLQYK